MTGALVETVSHAVMTAAANAQNIAKLKDLAAPTPAEVEVEKVKAESLRRIDKALGDARAMSCTGEMDDDPFEWTNVSDPAQAKLISALLRHGRTDSAAAERAVDPVGQWTTWATGFDEEFRQIGTGTFSFYRAATMWQALTPAMRQGLQTEVRALLNADKLATGGKWTSPEQVKGSQHIHFWVYALIEAARSYLGGVPRAEEGRLLVQNFKRSNNETLVATFERFKRAYCLKWQSLEFSPQPAEQHAMQQLFIKAFDAETKMHLLTEQWNRQSTWAGARTVIDQVMH